jgi:hypothetical protein
VEINAGQGTPGFSINDRNELQWGTRRFGGWLGECQSSSSCFIIYIKVSFANWQCFDSAQSATGGTIFHSCSGSTLAKSLFSRVPAYARHWWPNTSGHESAETRCFRIHCIHSLEAMIELEVLFEGGMGEGRCRMWLHRSY